MSADPLLPDDGDYPTGPIDVWPLMAEDAPAGALMDDNGHLHDKRSGRFTKKRRPGAHRAPAERVATRAVEPVVRRMLRSVPVGNVGIIGYESDNSKSFQNERLIDGSTRRTYGDGTVVIVLPGAPLDENRVLYKGDPGYLERVGLSVERKAGAGKPAASAATIRAWAQSNGIPVSAAGRVPQAVMDAYRRAHA